AAPGARARSASSAEIAPGRMLLGNCSSSSDMALPAELESKASNDPCVRSSRASALSDQEGRDMDTLKLFSIALVLGIACGTGEDRSTQAGDVAVRLGSAIRCGALVSSHGDRIEVRPSGGEDTANLQCALDNAIAAGRPMNIQLAAG